MRVLSLSAGVPGKDDGVSSDEELPNANRREQLVGLGLLSSSSNSSDVEELDSGEEERLMRMEQEFLNS